MSKRKDPTKNLKGLIPESWLCVDCGINTAPGLFNRVQMERAFALERAQAALEGRAQKGIDQTFDDRTEVYTVREAVWKEAKMRPMDGCLCISCLEMRLGRALKPKDFLRDDAFKEHLVPSD